MFSFGIIQRANQWLPIFATCLLVLFAGFYQTKIDLYLKAQHISTFQVTATLRELDYQALYSRIETYCQAFINRNYETMYQLSYFKDVPKPSLIEYRNLRDPQYTFRTEVRILEVELFDNKGTAHLELTIEHPLLGVNKSTHIQEWEKVNDKWYRIDYGY